MSGFSSKKARQAIEHAQLIERTRKQARIVIHDDIAPQRLKERSRLEAKLHEWLKFYLPEIFTDEWSPDHLRVLGKVEQAIESGGLFAQAMPRGHGKSTICRGAALYAMLTGKRKYVLSVAATAELSREMLDFVRRQLAENDALGADYPEACAYIRAIEGKAIKAKYQLRYDGKPSGIEWAKDRIVLPSPIPRTGKRSYACAGATIEVCGLTGNIRGRNRQSNGRTIRPDFIIIDDPQTRESSESPSQCSTRERIITGDIMGLSGPRKKISCVMPCTIIKKGDLADRFLDRTQHPEWQGETCRLVYQWPDAHESLWRQYGDIYRNGIADGEGTAAANAFYQANRAAMDAGAVVSWEHRIRDGEISAIQTAENMLIEMGGQFFAEMQNDPKAADAGVYEITTDHVLSHQIQLPRFMLPDSAHIVVGGCDINRIGLHWIIAAFDQGMTPHIAAYGRWPASGDLWEKNATEQARKQAIFRGLAAFTETLNAATFVRAGARARIDRVLVDRGYEADTVHRFALSQRQSFQVVPTWGYAATNYRPKAQLLVGRPMEGCHISRSELGAGYQYLAFNADYWREIAQRAFLALPGEPGAVTLHAPPPDLPRYHQRFAEQLCSEQLANKYQTDGGTRWEWSRPVGMENHWLDAYTHCWVAAASLGLNSSGQPHIEPKKRRPHARVQMVKI